MSPELVGVLLAGLAAGTVNTIVGAGTLLTFPLLVALGVPPLVANASNTVGLVPGAVTGVWGYRRELTGQWARVGRLAALSAVGGATGAMLAVSAPPGTFTAVVPWLLVLAAGLAAVQPRVGRALRRHAEHDAAPPRHVGLPLALGVAATGVYGGYFGAAQGVILISLLGILWSTDLQRANGAKNVLAGTGNAVGAVVFVASGLVDWRIAGLVALGSAVGGVLGARLARQIPAPALRVVIVFAGLGAAALLWWG